MFIWWDYNILCGYNEIYDWLVVYLPLWKIWVRQLGSWNSQYGKMFQPCSKPPTRWYMDMEHGEPNWCFFPGGGRKYRPPNSVKKSRAAQVWTNNVGGSSTKWFLRWVIYPKKDRVVYHGRKLMMFTGRGRGLHHPPASTGWFQMARWATMQQNCCGNW